VRDASVQGDQANVNADVISIVGSAMDRGCLVAGNFVYAELINLDR